MGAAVLWNGGISFGGVIAVIFDDLIVLPVLKAIASIRVEWPSTVWHRSTQRWLGRADCRTDIRALGLVQDNVTRAWSRRPSME